MSNFNNYSKFENVGINSSNDRLIVMNSSFEDFKSKL